MARTLAAGLLTLLVLCGGVRCGAANVCGSIRMQNNVEDLRRVENCTIITGSLMLLLIENVEDSRNWQDYSFPNLVEVWEFVLVYRVNRLTTLGNLFPNLRLIRGRSLINNYALLIFSVEHLEQIGLQSLRKIERGDIIIGDCPNLCYFSNTIDWNHLGGDLDTKNMTDKYCDNICPKECNGYCWSSTQCQDMTPLDECIKEDGRCVTKCSKDRILLQPGTECLTVDECASISPKRSWLVYNQTCINKCPPKYKIVNNTCEYCGENCFQICQSKPAITTRSTLESFEGCTHVNGSVELAVTDDKLAAELEKYMGEIKEISGYLKITQSRAIKSLEFLRNLRRIKGIPLERNNSLIIQENKNLNKLWTFDSSFKMVIERGRLSFHYNPELPYKDILKLNELTINAKLTDTDVSSSTNGENTRQLHLKAEYIVHKTNVSLTWTGTADISRGFLVYYIEDYDYRDSWEDDECKANGWNVDYTSTNAITLVDLKPYTNYSFYIAGTILGENLQGKTNIFSFVTLSGDPSGPRNIEAISYNATAIKLIWDPPAEVRGILEKYVIIYYKITKDVEIVESRDYCAHPVSDRYVGIPIKEEWNPIRNIGRVNPNGDCDCPAIPTNIKRRDIQHLSEEYNLTRFDQQMNEILMNNDKTRYFTMSSEVVNTSQTYFQEQIVPADQNSTIIGNLDHFSTYMFYISACNINRTLEQQCSEINMIYNRTSALANADDLSDFSLSETRTGVLLNWTNPIYPNSPILSYTIHWKGESSTNQPCVLPADLRDGGYVLHLLPGDYSIRVRAITFAGKGNYTAFKSIYVGKAYTNDTTLIIALMCVFVVLIAAGGFLYYRCKKRHELENIHLIQTVNPDYCGPIYVADDWEIDHEDIDIGSSLGKGTFGTVYSGYLKSRQMPCAVKTVNISSTYEEKMQFLNEGAVMKSFSNAQHVVRLLGVVSRSDSPLVIMELMACGDLKNFLRRSRDSSQSIGCNEMYRMAIEIADGMAYLAAKKFIHRDLAARNCMVAGDHTIKIGDFGMARDIYETDYYRKESQGLLPVRWMAPESLADGVFTTDSDVWSYGIVLWEIVTLAEQPYQGLGNAQVWQFVIAKGRLSRPPECPDLLYDIMEVCWKWQPNKRPQFVDIVHRLENHVSEDFKVMSFYHCREGQEYLLNAKERPFNPPAMSQITRTSKNAFAHYHRSDENIGLYNDERDPINYPSNPNQRQNLLTDFALEEDDMPGSNGYASLSKT